ncbi:MAG: MarR family transcriptional regulator [Labilithrix sp.]|nr:MarR family transcriptional regulator [Labilithrix sp.]
MIDIENYRLKRAHLRANEICKKLTKPFDLTPARFEVLAFIRDVGGTCRQSEIWSRLDVSRATICRMLDAMEVKGLLWRAEEEGDRRQRTVGLTDHGRACLEKATDVFRAYRAAA